MAGRARANGEGSIYPHRNGFAAYAWVTKPDGTRARKYVYGKTREEVHEKWIKLLQLAGEGVVATKVPTLGEYLTYWLREVVQPNLAPLTCATYETFVRLYIVPGLGGKKINRLTVSDVQTWINKLPRTCQCCAQGKDARRTPPVVSARRRSTAPRRNEQRCCALGKCCHDYPSGRTVRDIRGCLRSALSHAQLDELVSKNVASSVKLPRARKPKRKAWTTEEARRFLESARSDGDPLYAAYILVLTLGLRKGEVLGLVWDDVDLDDAELVIGSQLQRVGRKLLHRETKTENSDAGLPMPSLCVAALRLRRRDELAAREAAGPVWQGDKLIFSTRFGMPIEPRTFNRAWDKRCLAAGVRRITIHDGRRTCATLLVDLDVHPRQVMQILRHAKFDVTMEIYAQASSKATRDALKRLGDSLDGEPETPQS